MGYLKHKIRTLTLITGLFMLCFLVGCEKEDNKFKMTAGMQFKEAEKSEQEATGSGNNDQDGENKNPNKKGAEEDATMEEISSQLEVETEEISDENQETESIEEQTKEPAETQSSNQEEQNEDGDKKDDKKDGDKPGGNKDGGNKYTPDYNGETLEIYVDIEDE